MCLFTDTSHALHVHTGGTPVSESRLYSLCLQSDCFVFVLKSTSSEILFGYDQLRVLHVVEASVQRRRHWIQPASLTDRQTDRQDRQTDRQTRQTDRQTDRQAGRQGQADDRTEPDQRPGQPASPDGQRTEQDTEVVPDQARPSSGLIREPGTRNKEPGRGPGTRPETGPRPGNGT